MASVSTSSPRAKRRAPAKSAAQSAAKPPAEPPAEVPVEPPAQPAAERPAVDRPSPDVWAALQELGVDPARHFANLLLPSGDGDPKRQDEAAKQLLAYCYGRRSTQASFDEQGQLVGYVL